MIDHQHASDGLALRWIIVHTFCMPTTPRRANKTAVQGAVFFSEVVARNIKDYRGLRRWHQEDLAGGMARLGHETWSRATVSQVETNGRTVTIDEILSLAVLFGVAVPALIDPLGVTGTNDENVEFSSIALLTAKGASEWVQGRLVLSLSDGDRGNLMIRGGVEALNDLAAPYVLPHPKKGKKR